MACCEYILAPIFFAGCASHGAQSEWQNPFSNAILLALGAAIILWALVPAKESDESDEFDTEGAIYVLSEAGKQYISEQIETHAKDLCIPPGWFDEAIQSANASDRFRHDVKIEIPKHLTLSGKSIVIKLFRAHFVLLRNEEK